MLVTACTDKQWQFHIKNVSFIFKINFLDKVHSKNGKMSPPHPGYYYFLVIFYFPSLQIYLYFPHKETVIKHVKKQHVSLLAISTHIKVMFNVVNVEYYFTINNLIMKCI